MDKVTAGRAVAHPMTVHKQNEAVVCADADRVTGGNGSQRKRAPEVEHKGIAHGGGWMGDPPRLPIAVGWIGLEIALGIEGEGCQDEGEKSENWTHVQAFRFPAYRLAENENPLRLHFNFAVGRRSARIRKGSSGEFNRRLRRWKP
jgi:hypothetical protein